MARFILEAAGEDITVGGDDVTVIGTNEGGEEVTIVGGNITLDASFAAGGDTIVLAGEAEDYTATVSGSRVILTSATGATVSIPVGTNGIAVDFGGDDTRILMVNADGDLMLGEQMVDAEGETTLDPGADDTPVALADALEAFLAAEQAEDAALEAIGREVGATQEGQSGTALETFVENYTAADIATDLDDAEDEILTQQAELATAQATLATARAGASDAEIQAAYEAALEDVQADATARDLLSARTEARADLQADIGENGSNSALLASLESAILAYGQAGGDLDTVINVGTNVTLSQLLTSINQAQATPGVADDQNIIDVVGDYDSIDTATLGSSASGVALAAQFDEVVERDTLIEGVDAAEQDLAADGVGGQLVAAESAQSVRSGQIAAVRSEQQQLATAEAELEALQDLVADYNDAVEEARAATETVEQLGYETPDVLENGSVEFGTSDSDIFVFTGEGNSTVSGFGDGDILYFGNEYTVVEVDSDVDFGVDGAGEADVLEVFVQQIGGNTVLTFEENAFSGSERDTTFDGHTVTLIAVNSDSLTVDTTGYISIEETAMA